MLNCIFLILKINNKKNNYNNKNNYEVFFCAIGGLLTKLKVIFQLISTDTETSPTRRSVLNKQKQVKKIQKLGKIVLKKSKKNVFYRTYR